MRKNIERIAQRVYEVCVDMQVNPETYVKAVRRYAPVLQGQTDLTPPQLISKDVKNYIRDLVALERGVRVEDYFKTICNQYSRYLENGWAEHLCLANDTFNFPAWFRILFRSERDLKMIEKYGDRAAYTLSKDPELVAYLRTIKADDGSGLDFSRIPNFKA